MYQEIMLFLDEQTTKKSGNNIVLVYCITRDETQRLQTSVKFAARAKRGLQSHELHSLCFVSSNAYYFS